MVERIVGLEIEKAYANLKAVLLEKNYTITAEEVPTFISVRQGSLWGISPVTAKKNVNYHLDAGKSRTRITCSSSLASDWKNLTIIGSVLSVVVVVLCLWISMDVEAFVTMKQPTYWSWIATNDGYIDVQTAEMLAGLTRVFAVFLVIALVAELAIVVYVHSRINMFAEETMNELC